MQDRMRRLKNLIIGMAIIGVITFMVVMAMELVASDTVHKQNSRVDQINTLIDKTN